MLHDAVHRQPVTAVNIRYRGVAKHRNPPLCSALFHGICVMMPKQSSAHEFENETTATGDAGMVFPI
jgi:hypothetical protein